MSDPIALAQSESAENSQRPSMVFGTIRPIGTQVRTTSIPNGRPTDRTSHSSQKCSNHGQLIDGSIIHVPESGFANTKGQWIIEGHGVDPDIDVENDPKSVIEGKDPQLQRAVAELMGKLQARPVKLPAKPAGPVKTERKP